jgi:hypothetical protein
MQHQAITKYTAEHISVRDTLINEAVNAGKIMRSRSQFWSAQYDADPAGTKAVLAKLQAAPGIAATSGAPPTQADTEYDPRWLTPGECRRVTAAGQQHHVMLGHD